MFWAVNRQYPGELMNAKQMWMVRAGEGSQFITEFIEGSKIAIGWGEIGGVSREELIKRVNQVWPADNKFKAANSAGQVYRFINEIVIGDEGRHDSSQD